jgi:hypothetical protein
MIRRFLFIVFCLAGVACSAQDFKVEFDPSQDFSRYATFMFGEGEIITPIDLRKTPDTLVHRWIRNAILDELTRKGMKYSQAGADLIVSYVSGTQGISSSERIGPLGLTPGSNPDQRSYQHDYRQGSLFIDLNDPKGGKLVWRINAVVNTSNPDTEEFIDQIVIRGFRKFTLKAKKTKRK